MRQPNAAQHVRRLGELDVVVADNLDAVTGEKSDEANSGRLPREKNNVDQGKESNCQARADNQHNQRRSIEKARSRLDRRLDDVSSFFVHKTAPRSGPYHTMGAK
jgi:hypothetical protein